MVEWKAVRINKVINYVSECVDRDNFLISFFIIELPQTSIKTEWIKSEAYNWVIGRLEFENSAETILYYFYPISDKVFF